MEVIKIAGVKLNHIVVSLGVIGHTTRCGVFLTLITLCYLNKGLEVYVKIIGARVAIGSHRQYTRMHVGLWALTWTRTQSRVRVLG